MNIQEFRKQYPQYNDMSDQDLSNSLYQKHYSDMDRSIFDQKFLGVQAQPQPQIPQPMSDPTSESLAQFSPSAAGQGARTVAPEIGMVAGGLLGSRIPIPGAGPALTGLGYAGGEAIKQGEMPSLDQFSQNFGKGAAMEYGGKALGAATGAAIKGLSWLSMKGGDKIAQGLQALASPTAKLAEKKMPLPPLTEAGQQMADKAANSWPGNIVVRQAHDKLRIGSKEMLEEFKNKFGVYSVTKDSVNKNFDTWIDSMGGPDAMVNMPKSFEVISEIVGRKTPIKASRQIPGNVGEIAPGVADSWDDILIKMDKLKQPELREKWVDEVPAAKMFWSKADAWLDKPTAQGIRDLWKTINLGKDVDATARNKLIRAIDADISAMSPEIATAHAVAKGSNTQIKQANVLKGIIQSSYSKRKGGGEEFNPATFARKWNENGSNDAIYKNFSPELVGEIDEFAGLMGAIGQELGRDVSKKSFGLYETAALLSSLGAGFAKSPEAAVAPLALGALPAGLSFRASRIYNPTSGIYQKALGNVGQAREMLPGLVNIGGKLMLLKGTEGRER